MKNIFIIFLLLIISGSTTAQDKNKNSFWAQVGTGISHIKFSDTNTGYNFSASFNYEFQNNNISLTYLYLGGISIFTHPEEYVKSYELKYGRSIDFSIRGLIFPFPLLLIINKDFNYSLIGKIGISYNEGLKKTILLRNVFFDDSYDSKFEKGFGLPIEIEIREEITNFLGMGLSVYTNFNKVKNYSGFNFNLYVGRFY